MNVQCLILWKIFNQLQMLETIAIAGAGTMGSGIAQVAAQSGFDTLLLDVQPAMLEKAKAAIQKNLQYLADKQKITAAEAEAAMERIRFLNNPADCRADLVIEAIVEKMEAKVQLFAQLAAINGTGTILATNTSSLSVTALQQQLPHPQRVVGMHFFNPAPLMKLVEVVEGAQTDAAATQTAYQLARQMGKTPVLCKDAPGFIVNRVARPYYLAAMRLVEQGLATIENVDAAMEAAGFKMGAFKLMDLIGMDVNYAVSCSVYEQLGRPARLQPSPLQQQKVAAGKLGRKTGEGFYVYT
jgi:3-hydroxybutyryl-CoA dehydrogenase